MRRAALLLLASLPLTAGSPADLVVRARYPSEPQGTMHVAEALTLSIGSARPLTLKGGIVPIPGPSFRLSDSSFVLLGWSSSGGGMQDIHALLLGVQNGAVKRRAYLTLTTDRSNSGLLVRHNPDGSLALGLPEPPSHILHNEDEWSLVLGGSSLAIAEIRRLTYEAVVVRNDDLLYSPPARLAPKPTSVSWIAITPQGFSLVKAAPR